MSTQNSVVNSNSMEVDIVQDPRSFLEEDITDVDTTALSIRVKHYLKFNQISYERFARLMLGITQSRLSTLLNQPQSWEKLSERVRAYYRRLQFWMDFKATFGNNPYLKSSATSGSKPKKSSASKLCSLSKPRSLLDVPENKAYLDDFDIDVDAMYANLHQTEAEQSSAIASIQADDVAGFSGNEATFIQEVAHDISESTIQFTSNEDLRGLLNQQELIHIDKIIDQINQEENGMW